MGAPDFPYPHRVAQPLGVLRLQLTPESSGGPPSGLWCPYSRDLTREVPHLVDHFPRGRIDRVVYAPRDWDVVASEVFTRHGRIKVGFLPEERRGGLVLLRTADGEVVRLQVVWQRQQSSSLVSSGGQA